MPNAVRNRRLNSAGMLYDNDAQLYFNQLISQPSAAWKMAVNTFFITLKENGNFTLLDRLWLHASEVQQHARVSLVNPLSAQITEVNSVTWTQGQGYTGNTGQYLNSNYNTATSSVQYTQDSGCMGGYFRNNITGNGGDMGVVTNGGTGAGAFINIRTVGNTFNYNLHSAAGVVGAAVVDSKGLSVSVRTANNSQSSYKNGVQTHTNANVSTALVNLNAFILGYNQNGVVQGTSQRQISLSYIGSGTLNQATMYTAVQTLATSLNFQV